MLSLSRTNPACCGCGQTCEQQFTIPKPWKSLFLVLETFPTPVLEYISNRTNLVKSISAYRVHNISWLGRVQAGVLCLRPGRTLLPAARATVAILGTDIHEKHREQPLQQEAQADSATGHDDGFRHATPQEEQNSSRNSRKQQRKRPCHDGRPADTLDRQQKDSTRPLIRSCHAWEVRPKDKLQPLTPLVRRPSSSRR